VKGGKNGGGGHSHGGGAGAGKTAATAQSVHTTETLLRTAGTTALMTETVAVGATVIQDDKADLIRNARLKGYQGDACGECGNFTLVRNGTCLKCDTCGGTTGCS